jgi:hypothetical protein
MSIGLNTILTADRLSDKRGRAPAEAAVHAVALFSFHLVPKLHLGTP